MRSKAESVIAERIATVRLPDGDRRKVRVTIRKPEARPTDGDYSCSFSVAGLGSAEEAREILGYDSIQSIELALRFIGHIISAAVPAGSMWEDAADNMGFPRPGDA